MSRSSVLSRLLALVVAALSAQACAIDQTVAPTMRGDLTTARSDFANEVKGVQRNTALDKDITVELVVGLSGGRIDIPAAGATLIVPAGAVLHTTTVRLTAVAGNLVAYTLEVDGGAWAIAPTFLQDLSHTDAKGRGASEMLAGHFATRDALNLHEGTANVDDKTELKDEKDDTVGFPAGHLNGGYIIHY